MWEKCAENGWSVLYNARPIRPWSEHGPNPNSPSRTRPFAEVTFRALDAHFVWKTTTFPAPLIYPNFTKYRPQKWHCNITKLWHLPRKVRCEWCDWREWCVDGCDWCVRYSTLSYSTLSYTTLSYSILSYSILSYSTSELLYSELLYGTLCIFNKFALDHSQNAEKVWDERVKGWEGSAIPGVFTLKSEHGVLFKVCVVFGI